MNIIYEDDLLLVINKPAGINCEDDGPNESLITFCQNYVGQPCFLVHRLDRNTGGLMVVAKDSKTAGNLSAQIQQRSFSKTYLAVIHGIPLQNETWTDFLLHNRKTNMGKVVSSNTPGAKIAILSFRVLRHTDDSSLVNIHLQTGRTHQIRIQFSHRGYSLYGDGKYGNRSSCSLALWSHHLAFIHPQSHNLMDFSLGPNFNDYPWNLFNEKEAIQDE